MSDLKKLGLIGQTLSHSFSKTYFSQKFQAAQILDWEYQLYELPSINELPALIEQHPNLIGLNVTIPYKKEVFKFLHQLDRAALEVGAVNTLKIDAERKLKGHNTDILGFESSLKHFLGSNISNLSVLVLGTGGAASAVTYVLQKLQIPYTTVSRSKQKGLTYTELSTKLIHEHRLIINCTPLGTYPKIQEAPLIPYEGIGKDHYLYDLIYNPEKTLFLRRGLAQGAKVMNGKQMLISQAEAAWEIWNTED